MTLPDRQLPAGGDLHAADQPLAEHDRGVMPVADEEPPRLGFPVVGIGASAGGLEAVIEFLSVMRADSGMAFVIVQHLPPDRESLVPEILARRTALPVRAIEDGMAIEPDHVYVIRPGRTLTLRDGRLHLGEPLATPMHTRPIDDFFKSLAHEQRERAIAVVMSGMGSNGAAGCQAVKAVGGVCIAQDPDSAQFPSMPRHLIDVGCADYVLPPRDIPDVLLAFAGHPYAKDRSADEGALMRDQQHVREILAVLRTRTHHDFSGYKKPTLLRRIQRRMGLSRLTRIGEYARLLRQTPSEITALADDLLIHVTGFFRDPEAWEALRESVLAPLIAARDPDHPIRAWVAACSSGEEAYTLAMLLVEEAERAGKSLDIKVFATDTAERTLQNARHGVYPGGIESEVTPARLERFFTREDSVYRVRPDLRERVVFAPQNILQDPPFSRLDIITCRNLLIYLEPDLQKRVLALLHFGLREGGTLFLGTSETVGGAEDAFEPLDKKARIFRRVGPTRHGSVAFPIPRSGPPVLDGVYDARPPARLSVAQLTTRALLEYHTPAAVTIDRDFRIVYFHGDTTPFIAQPSGEPSRDLLTVVRDVIRGSVRSAVHRAMSTGAPVTVEDGVLEVAGGRHYHVGVTASPILGKPDPELFVVSFQLLEQRSADPQGEAEPPESAEELRRMRDELQSTIEELQTSNEELKAAHEEVVSTNEELQSSNEELETSREEMQSLNEELSTVNSQLQSKMEEYQAVSGDLASLLTSADIAVLFLDTRFRIRRYTPQVKELLDVIATDIGRPLSDLARKFSDPELIPDAAQVLERLLPSEREISVEGNRWFVRRITPYRTADNRIDGVVITFVETTDRHRAEAALRASEEQFRRCFGEAPIPVIILAENGEILQLSSAWTDITGHTIADVPTFDAWLALLPAPQAAVVRARVRDLFRGEIRSFNAELPVTTRSGEVRQWSLTASSPSALADGRRFVVGMAVDISGSKQAELKLRSSARALEVAGAMKDQFLASVSHELRTPLSVILMWAKLLARGGVPDADRQDAIDTIVRSAEAQRRLIEDLLDVTRISSGKLRVEPRPLDINAVARSAAESVRPLLTAKGLAMQTSVDPSVGAISGDPGRIEQVVWILLTNAVKFSPPGTTIRLNVAAEPAAVSLTVADEGIGFTPEFRAQLFQPFMQAADVPNAPKTGLGLGLSIAKSLVELHKGTISAESPGLNLGATFTVRLPRTPAQLPADDPAVATPPGRPLTGATILLVEDNADALKGFKIALEHAGATVTPATSGAMALELVAASRPDGIVSDVGMPELNGLELIARVRTVESHTTLPRIPALALTALATARDQEQAFAAGFDAFLAKPVEPEQLVARVAELLGR